MTPARINPSVLSELISRVYDCAVAPEGWQQTLEMICENANFRCASIYLLDRRNKLPLIRQCAGVQPDWIDRYFADQVRFGTEIYNVRVKYFEAMPSDEPQVLSRDVPREAYINTRYFNEWMKPQGLVDVMQLLMLRKHDRHGAISFGRSKQWGPFDESGIALGSLLQPHLRRAVTISDLLDVQSLRTDNFQAVIGRLSTGIILVTEDGAILEINPAAEQMLASGRIIQAAGGRLSADRPDQVKQLQDAIALAAKGATSHTSGGLALGSAEAGFAIAHILPLSSGNLRAGLHRTAAAAIFISPDSNQFARAPKANVLGLIYGLTDAETRVAEALADGKTSLQAANLLGISEATIRSHLTRIFTKTGVSRQAELISLMNRLTLPLYGAETVQKP